jgi:predicted nucleotidyltransferase
MQISPAQLEIYKMNARKKSLSNKNRLEVRRAKGLKVAQQAARILKSHFGATRVVLFGSLLHADLFHSRSDIDLAVWDIQKLYQAVSRVMDIDHDFQIDIVPMEDASPDLQHVIETEGEDL